MYIASGGQQGLADRDIRQRAAEQLAVGLSKAVQEAAAKADHGGGSDMPDAQELGVAVEEALYDLHGKTAHDSLYSACASLYQLAFLYCACCTASSFMSCETTQRHMLA